MDYCGVMIQSGRYIVVPAVWLENKENKLTKVFYSPNQNDYPDFKLPVKYFFNENERSLYNAYVMQFMRKYMHFANR